MPTEHIKYTDFMYQGTDKLNKAIDQANKAEVDSAVAKDTAEQALANSEQTQTELTQAILAGDSSPLGGQLSVGADGEVYQGPQERLIAENQKVMSLMAHKANLSYVDEKVSKIPSGSPRGAFATRQNLVNAHPNGDSGIYVVTDDANWYFWDGTSWEIGGAYFQKGAIINPLTNLVSNGDFSNGSTSWTPIGATITSIDNLEMVVDTTAENNRVQQNLSYSDNDVIYRAAMVKSTSSQVGIGATSTLLKAHSGSGNYELLSHVGVFNASKNLSIVDKRTSGWNGFSVKYVIAINLTKVFGKGKEPNLEEMNTFLSAYSEVGWFDGTVNSLDGVVKKAERKISTVYKVEDFLPLKNDVINGNFDTNSRWSGVTGTLSFGANHVIVTGNGSSASPRLQQTTDSPLIQGDKYYASAKITLLDEGVTGFNLQIQTNGGSFAGNFVGARIPKVGKSTYLSGIVEPSQSASYSRINIQTTYLNASASNGKRTKVEYVVMVNLTKIFGAGNEPLAYEMDSLLKQFENRWFDSVLQYPDILKYMFDISKKTSVVQNPKGASVKAVAHRGYSFGAPENTLPAYKMAKEKGFYYVEADILWSSDGVPVMIHDTTIDRTSNGTGNVADLTLEQLKSYDYGSWKSQNFVGTKIPTFEEFILYCKKLDLHPYLDLKSAITDSQATILTDTIKKLGMGNQVTWISYLTNLNRILEKIPDARVGLLKTTASLSDVDDCLAIKTGQNDVFLNINFNNITKEIAEYSLLSGIPLETHTVNDHLLLEGFVEKGVSGITTDILNIAEILGEE